MQHLIGLFDNDGNYEDFITQGAKKYCFTKYVKNKKLKEKWQKVIKKGKDKSKVMEITVAGVPKQGVYQLNKIEDFRDDLKFEYKNTNKNLIIYTEEQNPIDLEDYQGNIEKIYDISGCCLIPTTYILGKSEEYSELIEDKSSRIARFKE